jgi:hypothetical protein
VSPFPLACFRLTSFKRCSLPLHPSKRATVPGVPGRNSGVAIIPVFSPISAWVAPASSPMMTLCRAR